jgi:enamine deaminase RidA (YjgF/YER057c/UK114 family)
MSNIETLLKESGSELVHICKLTVYLIDPRHREAVYRTMGPWLKGVYPVSTWVVVSMFTRPEFLIEIDVTAVIPTTG